MNEQLSYGAYFKRSLSVTSSHYGSLIQFSLIIGLYYFVVGTLFNVLPFQDNSRTLMMLMGAWFIMIPLLAGYFFFHEQTLLKKNPPFIEALVKGFERILPLFATLLALILGPGLLVGFSLFLYLFALKSNFAVEWVGILISVVSVIGIMLLMNNRLLSLSLVMNNSFDSSTCIEQSKQMVQNHYLRTLFRSTLIFFIMVTLLTLPILISFAVALTSTYKMAILGCVSLLIVVFIPWLWSFVVVDKLDLERLRLQKTAQTKKQMQSNMPQSPKGEMKKEDWF